MRVTGVIESGKMALFLFFSFTVSLDDGLAALELPAKGLALDVPERSHLDEEEYFLVESPARGVVGLQ